jgi:hypothetical protein
MVTIPSASRAYPIWSSTGVDTKISKLFPIFLFNLFFEQQKH